MRSADCIICGPTRKRLLQNQNFKDEYVELVDSRYHKESRRLVICESCGLVYHDPQFDGADLEVLYARFRDESFRKKRRMPISIESRAYRLIRVRMPPG